MTDVNINGVEDLPIVPTCPPTQTRCRNVLDEDVNYGENLNFGDGFHANNAQRIVANEVTITNTPRYSVFLFDVDQYQENANSSIQGELAIGTSVGRTTMASRTSGAEEPTTVMNQPIPAIVIWGEPPASY